MRNGRPWAVRIMPAFVCVFAAFVVGYGLGEQAQLGEQDVQTVTQEVRQTGDVKRLCMTVKTGERIDAMSCVAQMCAKHSACEQLDRQEARA